MTPTPTILLFVALFWTLPASAAVVGYKKYDGSFENMTSSLERATKNVFEQAALSSDA